MKLLFLILIISTAKASYIGEVDLFLKDGEYTSFAKLEDCQDKYSECFDISDINPYYAELIDNEVIDYVAWRQVESCTDELDCDAKFSYLKCTEGTEIKNYEALSVYCAVNIMKIEGKKLVESAVTCYKFGIFL